MDNVHQLKTKVKSSHPNLKDDSMEMIREP